MGMVINTNIASLTAQRHLDDSRAAMETSMERLSSGKRINSAMDDAAGMAVVHKLDAKIAGLNQAVRNANDGMAMINVAEGALEEIGDVINRMKELAVQASNDTYSTTDRAAMDAEYQALEAEVIRISDNTDFNGTLVVGSTTAINIHVGDKNAADDSVDFTPVDMGALTLTGDLTDRTNALAAIAEVDTAIAAVDSYRSALGATANRLDHAVDNLMNRSEHQSAARSRIEDADFAIESANLAKAQVLQQAGTAMLAQANSSTQNVMALLK